MTKIIDISHHQDPAKINYDKLAKEVDLVIIRTQFGSKTLDRYYKTHHAEFKMRGVPTAAYAWVRGVSIKDMEVEATDFYNRTKDLNPTFWFLDVEEKSMPDMRAGVSAYAKKLRSLGAKKVGVYIGHHLYKSFNINVSEFDAVWIPHYGSNNGQVTSKPSYACDLHQYTDKGRINGYNGALDLNRIIGNKTLEYFTGKDVKPVVVQPPKTEVKATTSKSKTYKVVKSVSGYKTAADAKSKKNKAGTVTAGTYYVFNESQGMINVTSKAGTPGSWINPGDNKVGGTSSAKYHTVVKGDTVSGLAAKNGSTIALIKSWNNLKDPNKIYVGQKLRVK